jgi:hypothetical protein
MATYGYKPLLQDDPFVTRSETRGAPPGAAATLLGFQTLISCLQWLFVVLSVLSILSS